MLTYTDELAREVLDWVAAGKSIRSYAKQKKCRESTIREYIWAKKGLFATEYEAAKESGYDAMADECVEIADDETLPPASRKIMVDTRLRLMGKWSQRYSEKHSHEVTGAGGTALLPGSITVTFVESKG